MAGIFLSSVRGELGENPDGTSRQEAIARLRRGDPITLVADPMNDRNRWPIGVFAADACQVGFLRIDPKDVIALLRGEPFEARVEKIVGGTNWWRRSILRKRHLGVVLRLSMGVPDRQRYLRLTNKAKPYDDAVREALALEKTGDLEHTMDAYRNVVHEIIELTNDDRFASAHRLEPAPIDRLTRLLEKSEMQGEALRVLDNWWGTVDPVQPPGNVRKTLRHMKARLGVKCR